MPASETVRVPIAPRRTQQERREATIAKLTDATVSALVDVGFARATVKEICARAGVSDGGMFRHFDTRLDLIVTAAARISERDLDVFRRRATASADPQALIADLKAAVRSPTNRVWHELLAAARTDDELRRRLEPATRRYTAEVRRVFSELPALRRLPPQRVDLWLQLLLHLFDGEAIFSVVADNPEAEDRLLGFVTDLIIDDVRRAG